MCDPLYTLEAIDGEIVSPAREAKRIPIILFDVAI